MSKTFDEAYEQQKKDLRAHNILFDEIETYPVYCGSDCGHFDYFNQCCWLSWWNKEEGDWCNYGLEITADREILTPKELEEMRAQGMAVTANA